MIRATTYVNTCLFSPEQMVRANLMQPAVVQVAGVMVAVEEVGGAVAAVAVALAGAGVARSLLGTEGVAEEARGVRASRQTAAMQQGPQSL